MTKQDPIRSRGRIHNHLLDLIDVPGGDQIPFNENYALPDGEYDLFLQQDGEEDGIFILPILGTVTNLRFGFIPLIFRNLSRSSCAFYLENGLWPFSSIKITRILKKSSSIINGINPKRRLTKKKERIQRSWYKVFFNKISLLLCPVVALKILAL